MVDTLGLPLLSGPAPSPKNIARADIGCRKCSKEFNVLFSRSRRCNHCGFSYCQSCSDFQALMPRFSGSEVIGYDPVHICGFCIEFLQVTASGKGQLKAMPLSKLKKYAAAYNIPIVRAVEKQDFVDAIVSARARNGCLPPANEVSPLSSEWCLLLHILLEVFYRTYSVPDNTDYNRRGIFNSLRNPGPSTPPQQPSRPRTNNIPTPDFPRPDLAPDDPPLAQTSFQPPPGPPPRSYAPQYTTPPPPLSPRPQYTSQHNTAHAPHVPPRPQFQPSPPPPPRSSRPQPSPYSRPTAAHSSHNLHANPSPSQPPRPRASSSSAPTPPPAPPPTLSQLMEMTPDSIRSLSIGTLKSILFSNHVTPGQVLEKSDLVKRVTDLVDNERRERERQRLAEEQEEQERIALQHAMMEEIERKKREASGSSAGKDENQKGSGYSPSSSPNSKPQFVERQGLCVICQDEDANIAIVDCGHLAMCRSCSELVMASSRECPLCRTRIVTEARLLRIFKT